MELWYPDAIVVEGNDAGDYTDLGEPKGLLHTTEGKSAAGSFSSYAANNSWPHFTVTYELNFFQVYQHVSIGVASRALKNLGGGVETNRDNVVQIEVVGTADIRNKDSWGDQYVGNFPTEYLDGIKKLMRWIEKQKGVPRICTVTFKSYPDSYGTNNGIRLSNSQWDAYSGWLGHQHAPENTHGDPGLIDIAYLLADDVNPFKEIDAMLIRSGLVGGTGQVAIIGENGRRYVGGSEFGAWTKAKVPVLQLDHTEFLAVLTEVPLAIPPIVIWRNEETGAAYRMDDDGTLRHIAPEEYQDLVDHWGAEVKNKPAAAFDGIPSD